MGSEIPSVDFVHGDEVIHTLQKDRCLYHLRQRTAGCRQNRSDVLQHAFGLRRDVASDELLRLGIQANLPGKENKSVGFNRLRVWSDCLRSIVGGDNLAHMSSDHRGRRTVQSNENDLIPMLRRPSGISLTFRSPAW